MNGVFDDDEVLSIVANDNCWRPNAHVSVNLAIIVIKNIVGAARRFDIVFSRFNRNYLFLLFVPILWTHSPHSGAGNVIMMVHYNTQQLFHRHVNRSAFFALCIQIHLSGTKHIVRLVALLPVILRLP